MFKKEMPQYTGLRGIAALLVLFFHVRTPQGVELTFGVLDPFSKFGFMGVDAFFVLSGFVITYVYGQMFELRVDWRDVRAFAVARFARLYPLHFVTTLMMLAAYAVAVRVGINPSVASAYSYEGVTLSLLLIQEWVGVVAPNPSSWSISVEVANYLIFPLIALCRPTSLSRYLLIGIIVLGAIATNFLIEQNTLRGMVEFGMGCAAYVLASRFRSEALSRFSGLVFFTPFLACYYFDTNIHGIAALCFAVSMILLAGERGLFYAVCSSRPVKFIGDISYSIYLLQWFVWIGWKHVLANIGLFQNNLHLMVVCASISLILVSIPSYYLFELPMRKYLRKLLDKKRVAAS